MLSHYITFRKTKLTYKLRVVIQNPSMEETEIERLKKHIANQKTFMGRLKHENDCLKHQIERLLQEIDDQKENRREITYLRLEIKNLREQNCQNSHPEDDCSSPMNVQNSQTEGSCILL